MEIEDADFNWLIRYIDAFMEHDTLGYFLTTQDVHKFNRIVRKYKK